MRRRIGVALVAGVFFVSGCSQIDSLAPVSGVSIATLTIAVGDVLVSAAVPILVAPTCVEAATSFTCNGSTMNDETITVVATIDKPQTMTIQIGDQVIYEGGVQDVLDKAAQEAP